MAWTCTICGGRALWLTGRCEDHCRCDGCGTREGLIHDVDGVFCGACYDRHIDGQIAAWLASGESTAAEGEVVCPWCGAREEECLDGGRCECAHCGRPFDVEVEVSYTTTRVEKADK